MRQALIVIIVLLISLLLCLQIYKLDDTPEEGTGLPESTLAAIIKAIDNKDPSAFEFNLTGPWLEEIRNKEGGVEDYMGSLKILPPDTDQPIEVNVNNLTGVPLAFLTCSVNDKTSKLRFLKKGDDWLWDGFSSNDSPDFVQPKPLPSKGDQTTPGRAFARFKTAVANKNVTDFKTLLSKRLLAEALKSGTLLEWFDNNKDVIRFGGADTMSGVIESDYPKERKVVLSTVRFYKGHATAYMIQFLEEDGLWRYDGPADPDDYPEPLHKYGKQEKKKK